MAKKTSPILEKAAQELMKEIPYGILQVEVYMDGVLMHPLVVEADGTSWWWRNMFRADIQEITEIINKRWPGVPVVDMTDNEIDY